MFNRFPARCCECGKLVPPGEGVVLQTPESHGKKPEWRVKCNCHVDWNQVKKIYRPKGY